MRFVLLLAAALLLVQDDYDSLLDRLKKESPGEYEKVKSLDRDTALRFLRDRYSQKEPGKTPDPKKREKRPELLPSRSETFERIEALAVGDVTLDLCRRSDGAFGIGAVRRGALALRRTDFLWTWTLDGRAPAFESRKDLVVTLRDPKATLTFAPTKRESAGARFAGFTVELRADAKKIVETASWEPGGGTKGTAFFDGYRGWHSPPDWMRADAVPETNPKLMPSLLHGTGFQLLHRAEDALLLFHASPGDCLKAASRGEALEFVTEFHEAGAITRHVLVGGRGSAIDTWTRGFEIAHAEIRQALRLPERAREILILWPPFARRGFEETARECAAASAREGFTGACIDVVWDNYEFHGGAKNMNVWDFVVAEGYGGEAGLKALVAECRKNGLKVIPWVPAGHLVDVSTVWKDHPDWRLGVDTPSKSKGAGPVYGDLHSGFGEYYRGRVLDLFQKHGFEGAWMDSHLSFAGQTRERPNSAKLAAFYRDLAAGGAAQLIVEGDASALGSYGIGIDESWGALPAPDLFLGSTMLGWGSDPELYTRYFRRYAAAGAMWVVSWDTLFSPKRTGEAWDAARAEIRRTVKDYARVKDRMVHRFVHEDGSGYTWTNDKNAVKIVWLFQDAALPDGRAGRAGGMYEVP